MSRSDPEISECPAREGLGVSKEEIKTGGIGIPFARYTVPGGICRLLSAIVLYPQESYQL